VIDSLSHAWAGVDGALEQVDKVIARSRDPSRGNRFTAWREVTPMQNELVDTMMSSSCHIIATMRTKTEWAIEKNEEGKNVPRKIGMAPIQRDGIEYEFDVCGDIDQSHVYAVTKSRCPALTDSVIKMPGRALGEKLLAWLSDGEAPSLPSSGPKRMALQLEESFFSCKSQGEKTGWTRVVKEAKDRGELSDDEYLTLVNIYKENK
jgi:hypothetical protein